MASAPENQIKDLPPFCHFVFRQRCCSFLYVCLYFSACGPLPLCRLLFQLRDNELDSRPLARSFYCIVYFVFFKSNAARFFYYFFFFKFAHTIFMVASQMFLFQVKRKQDKETKQQKEQETQRPPQQSACLTREASPSPLGSADCFFFFCGCSVSKSFVFQEQARLPAPSRDSPFCLRLTLQPSIFHSRANRTVRTESQLEKSLSDEAEARTVFFSQFNFIKFEGLYEPPAQQVMETLLRRLIKALQVSDAKF